MKNFRPTWISCAALFAGSLIAASSLASAAVLPPFTPPQNAAGCLDLASFLSQIRAQPDQLFMHHSLVDVTLQASDDSAQVTDLANQHALDLFYHPNLITLGLAAARSGGGYLHDFTAYQLDCSKLVTGDIFAAEGMSVIWQISDQTANSLTLKRLTKGGNAEITSDLTLAVRRFQVVAPMTFAITSLYSFDTQHACATGAATETDVLSVTELFAIDSTPQDPQDVSSDGLKALLAKYPRLPAPSGHRGEFANPVTPKGDSACVAPAATVQPSK
jgi:hypothetical protein